MPFWVPTSLVSPVSQAQLPLWRTVWKIGISSLNSTAPGASMAWETLGERSLGSPTPSPLVFFLSLPASSLQREAALVLPPKQPFP